MSTRRAVARISRPKMEPVRRPASVRPLRGPDRPQPQPPAPQHTESGVRRKLATLPPAAAQATATTGPIEEVVAADLSDDPRCDD